MADVIFEELFSDERALKYLEAIEKQAIETGKAADKMGQEFDDALTPPSSGFGLGINDALTEMKRKYKELADASVVLRNAIKNATDPTAIKLYQKGLQDVNAGMATLETTAKKAGVALKDTGKEVSLGKQVFRDFFGEFTKAALITTAITKVVDFTKYAVGLAQETKKATLQFEAFLGSAEKAGAAVSELQAFAGEKLIDTGEVLAAGKSLLAFGESTDNLIPVLSRVADISAATGKNFGELVTIYGKARDAGVLYAEDINQLVDAGIPIIQEFAKQMGVSNDQVKKLASEGKISFEELQLAFFNLTEEGGKFAGQAEINAKTISGAWQGLVAELRPAIEGLGNFFSDVAIGGIDAAKSFAQSVGNIVQNSLKLFGLVKEEQGAFFDTSKEQTQKGLSEQERLEQEAAKRRLELQKQNNAKLAAEAKKRRDQRLKEFDELLKDADRQAAQLDIANTFNPVEQVQKRREQAIKAANELQAQLISFADTPAQKEAVKKSMERLFVEIERAYAEELAKAAIELEKLKGGKIREALLPLPAPDTVPDDIKFRVQGLVKSLQSAAKEAIEGQTPGDRPSLAELLGLSPDQLEGIKDATAQIIDSLGQISEARVKEAEAATRAADERVKAAEDALEKEQELAAEGLANNVSLRQKELAEAKAAREEAAKEEAQARRTQILLDSAGQISSLVTASANIFKSLSTIPFAGIPLAIATIGIMFGAFAKAKADALKAAQIPKFRKGTKLEGRSHEAGGLAISDEYGNVVGEAEGGEWLIGTKPSREHDNFLKRLNTGEFSGVNLDRLIPRPSASNPITESAGRIERIEREYREIQTGQHYAAMVAAYEKASGRIVQAIESKEVVFPLPNGYKVQTRKGRNVDIDIVKFK